MNKEDKARLEEMTEIFVQAVPSIDNRKDSPLTNEEIGIGIKAIFKKLQEEIKKLYRYDCETTNVYHDENPSTEEGSMGESSEGNWISYYDIENILNILLGVSLDTPEKYKVTYEEILEKEKI